MRLRRHNMRLSTRLLFIVLTCLLPVMLLGVWVEYSHWAERRAQLGDLALQQAQLLNGDVGSIAEGVRSVLSAVAQLDEVRNVAPACNERLSATQRNLPIYAFVALLDADGRIACTSEPIPQSPAGDQPQWIHDAMTASWFAAGRFATAPGISPGFLPFALPLAALVPARRGALVAGLDLERLSEHFARLRQTGSPFLAGSALTVADRDGVILARSPQHEEFVGKRFPPAAMALVTAQQSGIARLKSIDDTYRVVGYIPAAQSPFGLMVAIGFAEPAMMADINRTSLRAGLLFVACPSLHFCSHCSLRGVSSVGRRANFWRPRVAGARAISPRRFAARMRVRSSARSPKPTTTWPRRLARREEDLRDHADALEARVAERTQELLVTNNRLQVEIAERQNTEAALVQSQKLQAVGQLAGGIAHDFNNLLATIQGSLDLLSQTLPPEEGRKHTWIERATGAVHRGSQLTSRLLAFSRRRRLAVAGVRREQAGLRSGAAAAHLHAWAAHPHRYPAGR